MRQRLSLSPACPSQEGHAGGMNENRSGALATRPSEASDDYSDFRNDTDADSDPDSERSRK